jgi:hypothetical protein
MRRTSICLAIAGLACWAAFASAAWAVPTVQFKAKAVPIPKPGGGTYKGTGNFYGKGAAVEAEYTISGTEYGGFPPPLIGVNFYLPKGTKLHPAGFKTCPKATLEASGPGPSACPKGSAAGPPGKVLGEVAFGKELVPEEATVESFYAPGGGLFFFTSGHSPVSLEILSTGHYINLAGSGGFGPALITQIPLVETVPGAQDASVLKIKIKAGSARKVGKKLIPYGTVPRKGKCPKGGFRIKTELTFAGLGGLAQQKVTKTYRSPCPRR